MFKKNDRGGAVHLKDVEKGQPRRLLALITGTVAGQAGNATW